MQKLSVIPTYSLGLRLSSFKVSRMLLTIESEKIEKIRTTKILSRIGDSALH